MAVALKSPTQAPMPDLNSQPLDPDEPTYCLCNQVSFGEMIGCDNEEVEHPPHSSDTLVEAFSLLAVPD